MVSGEQSPGRKAPSRKKDPLASRMPEQSVGMAALQPVSSFPAGECQGTLNTVPRTLLLGAGSGPHALLPDLDPGAWSLFVPRLV